MRDEPVQRLMLLGVAWAMSACAVSLSAVGGPNIDPDADVGGEAHLEALAEAGNKRFTFFVNVGAGGGRLPVGPSKHGLLRPEVGLGFGADIRGHVGVGFPVRLYESLGEAEAIWSVVAAADVLFPVVDLGAEDSRLELGPRVSIERLALDGERLLIGVSLVLRWVMFSTIGDSWSP